MNQKILYNPFYYIAGTKSFLVGIVGLLLISYLAYYTGTHYNGILNIEFAKDSDLWVFLLENITFWFILSTLLYIAGIIFSESKIRPIDIYGTTLIARFPLLITPVIRIIPVFHSFVYKSVTMYLLICIYLVSLTWMVTLLLNAFKITCNLKNEKFIISFIVSILLSEILTKITLYLII